MFSRRRSYYRAALLASTRPPAIAAFVPGDPYRKNVILDLRTDGTDAGNNKMFTDSSPSAHAITANGNVAQGSFSPYQPNGWVVYLEGAFSGDYVAGTIGTLGTGDFTIQLWIKPLEDHTTGYNIFGGMNGGYFGFKSGNVTWQVAAGEKNIAVTGGTSQFVGRWVHYCLMRSGSTIYAFLDGVLVGSATDASNFGTAFKLGSYGTSTEFQKEGLISNVKITSGADYSTSGFDAPTADLSDEVGCELLIAQSNRFFDNSEDGVALSVTGAPVIIPGGPFAGKVAYNPITHGGSSYFSGSNDYLTLPTHAGFAPGIDEYTFEAWVFLQRTSGENGIASTHDASDYGFSIWHDGTTIYFEERMNAYDGANPRLTGTVAFNQWIHIALCREAGTGGTLRAFINGVVVDSTGTNLRDLSNQNGGLIGGSTAASNPHQGFLTDARLVIGSALYTEAFTPPSARLTAVTNTELLLNMQDAAIYDATCNSNFRLIGDTETDTAQIKFSDSSVLGDGTGDYAQARPPATGAMTIGTRDFTIEFWVRLGSTSGTPLLFDTRNGTSSVVANVIYLFGGNLTYWVNGVNRITGTTLSTGVWYHVAVCREDSVTRMFLNGVQDGSDYADTNDYIEATQGFNFLGTAAGNSASAHIEGARVTLDTARYLGTFTLPTEAYPQLTGYSLDAEATTDPYWNKVQLLLKTLSPNGLDNNAFTDSSSSGHTITTVGRVTQGAFSPYVNGSVNKFVDGDSKLVVPYHADHAFGTADFTVSFWMRSTAATNSVIGQVAGSGSQWCMTMSSNQLYCQTDTAVTNLMNAGSFNDGEWHHVAWTRSGSSNKLWRDGVQVASSTNSTNFNNTANTDLWIGGNAHSAGNFVGELAEVHVVKGTALWTEAFTPPRYATELHSDTKLLTCQNGAITDASTGAHVPTCVDPETLLGSPTGPFITTAPYLPATHGGSAYFDGIDDFITVADSSDWHLGISSEVFTVECWFYAEATGSVRSLLAFGGVDNAYNGTTGIQWRLIVNAGDAIQWQGWNGSSFYNLTSAAITENTWHHIAVGFNGTTTRVWLDGTSVASAATTYANVSGASTLYVGRQKPGATPQYFPGYISDLRIVKGTDVYGANNTTITVPTAPLTAITNTKLLLPCQAAGIYDATCQNNLALLADTQTDTTTFKFGPTSVLFDGTGDKIIIPNSPQYEIADQDFTLEFWVKINTHKNWNGIFDARTTGTQAAGYCVATSSGVVVWNTSATDHIATPVLKTGVWYHVAITRKNGVTRIFSNGEMSEQYVDTVTYLNPGDLNIGGDYAALYCLDGALEDLRYTIGEARYEADFAIPTSDLPAKGA